MGEIFVGLIINESIKRIWQRSPITAEDVFNQFLVCHSLPLIGMESLRALQLWPR